ncbi:MAG: molybdopterin cofactor-binding domain-containing protein [bacterium]
MSNTLNLNRREFIKVVSTVGGGFVLGFYLPTKEELFAKEPAQVTTFEPNAWLKIDPDGTTTITVARSEMGQGVRTSLPMIVAEELEAEWSTVRIELALADPKYGDMTTGGSTSVRTSWEKLRKAGATAREMLITAAAQTWNVDRATCRAEKGVVIHNPSKRRLTYGELVETTAKLSVPEIVPLKDPKDFRIIGQSLSRLDSPEKTNGSAVFGIDMEVPGMLVAMVEHCPVFGGKVKSFDATKALAIKGVRHAIEIESGIAVVADSTWAAMQGREALNITWDEGENARLDSEGIGKMFEEKSKQNGVVVRKEGDATAALATAAKKIEAVYEAPFLAHATMEPMNCVAHVRQDGAELWAPTQAPQWVQRAVAEMTKLPPEKIKVHTTLLGGGFGRRLMPDFAVEAARVSKAVGAPIKLVWTREDDMRHDFYRPASYHRVAAGIDNSGQLIAWTHQVVAPSIMQSVLPQWYQEDHPDPVGGAEEFAYKAANILVDCVVANTAVPVGWWRSVYNTQNAFVNECFLDEIAAAAGVDPYEFRRRLLPEDSRLRGPLELAASKARWDKPPAAGRFRGIACHASFGSFFAEVAEVSVNDSGTVRVHKVVCALDCGAIVHPDTIKSQVEGAVVYGLSAALMAEITIERGRVVQGNFDDYPMLTIDMMPEVEVYIVPSTEAPGGIGEPGVPPITPAVCNAIFAATGKRIRRLPIQSSDLI